MSCHRHGLARKARATIAEMERIADIQREREVMDSTHADRWSTVEEILSQTLKNFFLEVEVDSVKILPDNPYYEYSSIRDPQNFFGRKEILRRLYEAISHYQSISLVGLPRIGKSSLLRHLQLPMTWTEYGYDLPNFLFLSLDMKSSSLSTRKGFLTAICEKMIEQRPGIFEPVQVTGMMPEDVFLHLLKQLSLKGHHLVLILDEFYGVHTVEEFDARFFSFLRSLSGEVSYVTASIEPLYKMVATHELAGSPFFNIFHLLTMGPLSMSEAKKLVTIPAHRAGMPFTDIETDWVLEQAGHHPFFLQRVCQHLFEQKAALSDAQLTIERFDMVRENAYQELLPHFDVQWSYLDAEEQNLLQYEIASGETISSKRPELSESGLFRRFVREKHHLLPLQIDTQGLREILSYLSDINLLGQCNMVFWNIVHTNVKADSSLMVKGMIVRDVLSKALEQLQGQGSRNDTSQDWRLYNILWYRYFKHHLKNEIIANRLSMSVRQYYREHERALQQLLSVLLDMERGSLNKG